MSNRRDPRPRRLKTNRPAAGTTGQKERTLTEAILSIFTRRRKRPEMDAVTADRLALMQHRVRQLGDRERELNDWKTSYALRTGRAA